MKELIEAAKAVIEGAKSYGSVGYADRQLVYLQAAVERAEKPPADFEEWLSTHNAAYPADEWVEFGRDAYKAAQHAERERIKKIVCDEYSNKRIDFSRILERIDAAL